MTKADEDINDCAKCTPEEVLESEWQPKRKTKWLLHTPELFVAWRFSPNGPLQDLAILEQTYHNIKPLATTQVCGTFFLKDDGNLLETVVWKPHLHRWKQTKSLLTEAVRTLFSRKKHWDDMWMTTLLASSWLGRYLSCVCISFLTVLKVTVALMQGKTDAVQSWPSALLRSYQVCIGVREDI